MKRALVALVLAAVVSACGPKYHHEFTCPEGWEAVDQRRTPLGSPMVQCRSEDGRTLMWTRATKIYDE